MLNIALVAGSGRNNSQSGKVARFLRQRLIQLEQTTDELRACEKTPAYCDRLQAPAADVALREKQGHLAH